jgi:hypothetical protein
MFPLQHWTIIIKLVIKLKNAVFWNVALCRSCVNRRFGGTHRLHLQGRKIHERGTSVSRWLQTAWRWKRYVPPKRWFTQDLHGATSQKTASFIVTAVKTLNLTWLKSLWIVLNEDAYRVWKWAQNCLCVTTTLLVSRKNNTVFMRCSTKSSHLSAILCTLAHEHKQHDTSALGKSKNLSSWSTVLPCYKTSFIAWLNN